VRSFHGVHVVADHSRSRRRHRHRRRRRRHHRRCRYRRYSNRITVARDYTPSNDVDDGVGGVRVAVAAVVAATAHRAGRRGIRRVQGGRADDHQTGLAVRPGTVRAGRRPGPGHGQQEVPGPSQGTSEESREQVNPL